MNGRPFSGRPEDGLFSFEGGLDDDAALIEIFARARTLDERLAVLREPGDASIHGGEDDARHCAPEAGATADQLTSWARTYSAGDREALSRRLSWDGLDEASVTRALAQPHCEAPLPVWTSLLRSALEHGNAMASGVFPDLSRFSPEALPRFAEVWIPFVVAARERLIARAGAALDSWEEEALLTLEDSLLSQIAWIAERVLYERFDALRGGEALSEGAGSSRVVYERFVRSLLDGELVPLLLEFSALARQVSLVAVNWTEALAELARRVAADAGDLSATFGASGGVARVRGGLSDRHAGGRSILMLQFRSGAWLVYKPRPMGMESAWNDFLRWLADRGASPRLGTIRVLSRDGYGYAELVERTTLETDASLREYFIRAGGLLAVAWALGAEDLHMDNVVASSDGPVVVDAETAFQPDLASTDATEATEAAAGTAGSGAAAGPLSRWSARVKASFLRSGLLTISRLDRDGRCVDIGGLRGEGGHAISTRKRAFRHPNTDAMTLGWDVAFAPAMQNLPLRDGLPLLPGAFREEVEMGFALMMGSLLSLRPAITSPGGPLDVFASHQTRLVFRPSDLYARVLLELSAPRYLRGGLDRSFAIDSLNGVFRSERVRPRLWPLTVEERASLEDFDVPYFSVGAASRTIFSRDGQSIDGHLARSGLEAARARLQDLSEKALGIQLSILRGHFESPPGSVGPGPAEFAELAEEIGDEVRGAAFEAAGPAVAVVPSVPAGEPDSLYAGRLGIALFFAALARSTGGKRFRAAARAILAPFGEMLRSGEASRESLPIGACNGIGSWIYTLATIAELTGDEEPLSLAASAASLLSEERIAGDSSFDVEAGAAGAILGLLALEGLTGEPTLLDRAILCGEHLLRSRVKVAEGVWGWPSATGLCLAGLAHGAAGITLAIGRLSARTGRADFEEAASAACRYESTVYDAERGNWPVLTESGEKVFMTAWCHGAPGIALARTALLARGGANPGFREELALSLDLSLSAVRSTPFLSTDHLCCGNAGIVEALLFAGEALDRVDLVVAARSRAAVLCDAARARGAFRFQTSGPERPAFGFFRGLSGLGYTLLRLARPNSLPCVAAFESARLPRTAAFEKACVGVPDFAKEEGEKMTVKNPGVRTRRLTPAEAGAFREMTFPAYRHLLDLEKAPRHLGMALLQPVLPVAVGAFIGEEPAGLSLAEIPGDTSDGAELLSLSVREDLRGRGIAAHLLTALGEELRAAGMPRVHAVYMTGQPSQEAIEKVFAKCGWDEPTPRMLSIRIQLDDLRRTNWYGRYRLDPDLLVFPWTEVTPAEREVLISSQRSEPWIPTNLEPWKHDQDGFEPVSSVGIRQNGSIVGWVINHAISPSVVRFTCSFIRKDLGRRGKLVPVYTESIGRLLATDFESCTFTVPLQHRGMAAFTLRWIGPLASFKGETRGTQKLLR